MHTVRVQCTYMYIGDLVTAVENNEEMATESGNRIQAGQPGNDHC